MRSFAITVFLLAIMTAGYITWRGQQRLALLETLQPPTGSSQSFNEEVEEDGVPRDENGAVLLSDPADDLGGFALSGRTVELPVGERDLYLLELYGPLARQQLLHERRVLKKRYAVERERAFREEFERGNFTKGTDGTLLNPDMTESRPTSETGELQVVELSRAEHPGVYELRDTLEWLGQRLGDE